ncbi:hypothetical protein [Nostoc sp.]|uniref:hypothetical protein n=1 Tax=Nostoc sp. TaxID=1180 RepID=UPI002FF54B27
MSNINNHGVDMNNNTLAQLNLSAVKERRFLGQVSELSNFELIIAAFMLDF